VESADLVVLAASAIETVRLALLSDFPDPHDRIGRDIMFHNFVYGFGLYFGYRVHAYRGRASTHCCEDLADPAYPGAQAFAQANGLPYIRGGIMELGGTQDIIGEGTTYQFVLSILGNLPGVKPFGTNFKQLMRASLLRDRIAGITMAAEDLPYPTNRVDLSPRVRDYRGFPVARVTYQPGSFEKVSTDWVITQMTAVMKAAKADVAAAVPASLDKGNVPTGAHIMGGMRMGADTRRNVTDAWGMVHGLDNVLVSDGSVFPSSGAQNPTLTIMATALRNVRHLIGARTPGASHPGAVSGATPAGSGAQLPATGQDALTAALGTAAIGGGLALHRYTAGE
jgi:gluconate 2-dehydrogenase alpha chain